MVAIISILVIIAILAVITFLLSFPMNVLWNALWITLFATLLNTQAIHDTLKVAFYAILYFLVVMWFRGNKVQRLHWARREFFMWNYQKKRMSREDYKKMMADRHRSQRKNVL